MNAKTIGLGCGLLVFLLTLLLPAPASMPPLAWPVAGLVFLMASWWMTEAVPLTMTALLPFIILPFLGVSSAKETATGYFSPTLFLILGGAFIALAIERTGLHRRLALTVLTLLGKGGGTHRLLLAFMVSSAILSLLISNTSASLIMMPMAMAVLNGGGCKAGDKSGISGALPMGIAFAASIGGLGTIVGSPTNAIAVGLFDEILDVQISFAQWSMFGIPMVIIGVPAAAWIIEKVQRTNAYSFDIEAARNAVGSHEPWSSAEKRVVPIILIAMLAWMTQPWIGTLLPQGALTDGTIAVVAGLALFIIPDGTGRPILIWSEGNRAPWDVIMMFGGGLALAAGMTASGLADWMGQSLLPLAQVPLIIVALAIVALVIVTTEFASNVATATGIIPVVASLVVALGADPLLLAMPAAIAASWGFMLPAGTGPNAFAWATGRIHLPNMLKAGFALDLFGLVMIIAVVWTVAGLM